MVEFVTKPAERKFKHKNQKNLGFSRKRLDIFAIGCKNITRYESDSPPNLVAKNAFRMNVIWGSAYCRLH